MDVDLELGGNDQMFNMMCGRDLMSALGMREKFVMTLKILADEHGKKMGKSEGNAVFLDNTPEDIYGKVMSWPDGVMASAFELCTSLSLAEILEIQKNLKNDNINPRDLKMRLAFLITEINCSTADADAAQEHFIKTVQKKEIPDDIEVVRILEETIKLIDLLVFTKLASSKGEARRLITQNGVKINSETISDIEHEVEISEKEILLQKGKRNFVKIVK